MKCVALVSAILCSALPRIICVRPAAADEVQVRIPELMGALAPGQGGGALVAFLSSEPLCAVTLALEERGGPSLDAKEYALLAHFAADDRDTPCLEALSQAPASYDAMGYLPQGPWLRCLEAAILYQNEHDWRSEARFEGLGPGKLVVNAFLRRVAETLPRLDECMQTNSFERPSPTAVASEFCTPEEDEWRSTATDAEQIYIQAGRLGLASYHFARTPDGLAAYISYARAPNHCSNASDAYNCWQIDDGSRPPCRKDFEEARYDPATRTFTGSVKWNPPFQGDTEWEYRMVFSESMDRISGGGVATQPGGSMEEYESHLFYRLLQLGRPSLTCQPEEAEGSAWQSLLEAKHILSQGTEEEDLRERLLTLPSALQDAFRQARARAESTAAAMEGALRMGEEPRLRAGTLTFAHER